MANPPVCPGRHTLTAGFGGRKTRLDLPDSEGGQSHQGSCEPANRSSLVNMEQRSYLFVLPKRTAHLSEPKTFHFLVASRYLTRMLFL